MAKRAMLLRATDVRHAELCSVSFVDFYIWFEQKREACSANCAFAVRSPRFFPQCLFDMYRFCSFC